jgi:hypothetical protein
MTPPLPASLHRFGDQLERAIERERLTVRRRRRALRLALATTAAAALALGLVALPGADRAGVQPRVATASAAERAAAALAVAPGAIVHQRAAYRPVNRHRTRSTRREETWRQTAEPYARREITVRGDARTETASVGERPAQLYDPATNTIYTNPPAGPALGTPVAAGDGDPLADQMASLLRSGAARAVNRAGDTIRFAYSNPLPDGEAEAWTYVVDARSYEPRRLTVEDPDGSRMTTRFETYERLTTGDALLDLRAQHPSAALDHTEAGYQAALLRTG